MHVMRAPSALDVRRYDTFALLDTVKVSTVILLADYGTHCNCAKPRHHMMLGKLLCYLGTL